MRPTGKQHIKTIDFVPIPGSTPARVGMMGKGLQINTATFDGVDQQYWPFILLHEEGHIAMKTTDEKTADRYAIQQLLNKGGSARTAIHALANTLDGNNPRHAERMKAALQYALWNRAANNNDPAALQAFLQLKQNQDTGLKSKVSPMEVFANLSIGSPMKKRARLERKKNRNEANSELKRAQATATITLAHQGIVFTPPPSGAERIIGGIANTAASIFGGGRGGGDAAPQPPVIQQLSQPGTLPPVMQELRQETPQPGMRVTPGGTAQPPAAQAKQSQHIIIAAVVAVVIIAVILLIKNRS